MSEKDYEIKIGELNIKLILAMAMIEELYGYLNDKCCGEWSECSKWETGKNCKVFPVLKKAESLLHERHISLVQNTRFDNPTCKSCKYEKSCPQFPPTGCNFIQDGNVIFPKYVKKLSMEK